MQLFRTTACAKFGHPELTVQLAEASPIPDVHRILINYFEGAVARGSKFRPGQRVQLGWSTLLLCERADGTIGVQERELSPDPEWTESVDRAVRDLWYQREVADSVGLLDRLAFPSQGEGVMVAGCAMEAKATLLTRLPDEDLPEGFSGWTLCCAQDHDHGERDIVPLLALAGNLPSLVQLLALPHGTTVFVRYRGKPGAAAGALRIEPRVFHDGEELKPKSGSYLAALQA